MAYLTREQHERMIELLKSRLIKRENRIEHLESWIADSGVAHNTCTYHILKKVCSNCKCKRAEVNGQP